MFSIWKNEILNPLEIWRITQDLQRALLILLFLYLQMLIRQILTQTGNHKCRKNVATKNVLFKKMGLQFRRPNFDILCKIIFIFLIKCQLCRCSEVNKAILEQVKVA